MSASVTPPSNRLTTGRRPVLIGFAYGLVVMAATVVIGGSVMYGTRQVLFDDVREYLRATAETAASLMDGDVHETFRTPDQEHTEAYAQAVKPLQKLL